jgi:group II intron reverse transcriptase/maturase
VTIWQTWRQTFRSEPRRLRAYEGARLEDIARLGTLAEAWGRVKANNGGPGGDGVTIAELAPEIESSLEELSKSLLGEVYKPQKIRRAFIKKANGGRRPLSIPAVIDRVAQTAAMLALEPEMDVRMSETSLAYRVGRGPPQAIRAVEAGFAQRLGWTVDADIKSYFDTIWHRQLMTDLAIWIDDERILRLLLKWLRTFGWRGRGVAQGAPISPLLANLYLHPFDRLMAVNGWRVVRYADDFVVQTTNEVAARRALKDVERLLRGRGLALNMEKTRIVGPDKPLVFLGVALRTSTVVSGDIGQALPTIGTDKTDDRGAL